MGGSEMHHEAAEQLYHKLSLCVHILPILLILVLLNIHLPLGFEDLQFLCPLQSPLFSLMN